MWVSTCCGWPSGTSGADDMGICLKCKDHCEYFDDEDELEIAAVERGECMEDFRAAQAQREFNADQLAQIERIKADSPVEP